MTTWSNVSKNKKKYKNGIAKLDRQRYEVLVSRRDPRKRGGRLSRRRVVRGSRYQAEAVRRQLEAELDAEINGQARNGMTLTEYVRQWLEARSAGQKPSTHEKYLNDLEKHILPALGHMRLDDLRPRHVVEFLAKNEGAANSKKNRLALLRVLAKDAIADDLVDRDFCLRVTVKVPKVYTEEEPNLLSGEQCAQVLEEIPQYWRDLACMLSFTGLRWGEITALHWQDVDLERGVLVVRWNNWKGTLVEPKSESSRRTVPLVEPLLTLLAARRERMDAEKHPGLRRGLVFPTRTGGMHKGTPLNPVLKAACQRAGVNIRFTPHGLRRTWNALARRVADGVVVRSMIGHASEAMTDHYSHVDRREKRRTAETVAGRLAGKRTDRDGAEADSREPGGPAPSAGTVADGHPPVAPEPALVDEMVDAGAGTPASDCPKPQ